MKRFEILCERIIPLIPDKRSAIFDVGCAKGGLLNTLRHLGYTQLYGVEMLPECISYLKDTMEIPVEAGSALDLPFKNIKADVLIYSHLAEHIIDLSAMLKAAQAKLNDSGIIYVEVPDASRYGEFTSAPYQDLYLEHVNHFDLTTLIALFGSGGFESVFNGQFELDAQPIGKVPCVWAIFRKGSVTAVKSEQILEQRLYNYMTWSRQHPAHARFAELAKAQTQIYLWGISQHAMLMMGQTALHGCNFRGFIDKDPSKRMRTILGCPIEKPDIMRHAEPECIVLIMAQGYEKSIASALDEIDFRGNLISSSGRNID